MNQSAKPTKAGNGHHANHWNDSTFEGFGVLTCHICGGLLVEHRIGRCPQLPDGVSLAGPSARAVARGEAS